MNGVTVLAGRKEPAYCWESLFFSSWLYFESSHGDRYIRNADRCPRSCSQENLGETSDTGSVWPSLAEGEWKA